MTDTAITAGEQVAAEYHRQTDAKLIHGDEDGTGGPSGPESGPDGPDDSASPQVKETEVGHMAQQPAQVGQHDCDECHGDVRPGSMCSACGINRMNEETFTWLQATDLPYYPPKLDCCQHAAIEVMLDPDGRSPIDIIVSHNHSADCDVWRYI